MPSIVYSLGKNLYINMTNECPCSCSFCIRLGGDGVGSADNLWLEREPTAGEVLEELERQGAEDCGEIVFCGYGEPFCALETMLEVCCGIRRRWGSAVIRINTNGLGDLINSNPTAPLLRGLADKISISLNTYSAERYDQICSPIYGAAAFPALLNFAGDCKRYVPDVILTVVDVLPPEDIEKCKAVAASIGVPLRVRSFS
ncbi:MAG: TatD family nuclease-associated radical SAM protein [Oscillospiraceae bacterium]|jgi:TatD family-associated radical SAM protein|nr:TatD family nuclease-associated radical SAM protein [Oscillospiraceae bacterium]